MVEKSVFSSWLTVSTFGLLLFSTTVTNIFEAPLFTGLLLVSTLRWFLKYPLQMSTHACGNIIMNFYEHPQTFPSYWCFLGHLLRLLERQQWSSFSASGRTFHARIDLEYHTIAVWLLRHRSFVGRLPRPAFLDTACFHCNWASDAPGDCTAPSWWDHNSTEDMLPGT